jgi:hypothetical protein
MKRISTDLEADIASAIRSNASADVPATIEDLCERFAVSSAVLYRVARSIGVELSRPKVTAAETELQPVSRSGRQFRGYQIPPAMARRAQLTGAVRVRVALGKIIIEKLS